MKKLIYLYASLALLFSCDRKGDAIIESEFRLNIDTLSSTTPNLLVADCIALETNDSSLIHTIDKILFLKDTLYVFDAIGKKILLFRDDGSFLYTIQQLGQGPGEYLYPTDIDIDDNGNIYVLDWATQRIIKYIHGNPKDYEEFPIGKYALDLAVTDSCIYLGRMVKNGKVSINLASWNKNSNQVTYISEEKELDIIPFSANHYIFRSGNEVFYYERFIPTIFQLEEDNLKNYISIISERYPTNDEIEELGRKSLEGQMTSQYIQDISACYDAGDYLWITSKSLMSIYSLIHKPTGKVFNMQNVSNLGIPYIGVTGSSGEEFISYCTPTLSNVEKIQPFLDKLSKQKRDRVISLSEDSNPILLFFNFE